MINYFPPILHTVREVRAIAAAYQVDFYGLWSSIYNTVDNIFVLTADDWGLSLFERGLGIVARPSDTLDIRRARILALLRCGVPYTMRWLEWWLSDVCGPGNSRVDLDNDNYILTIKLHLPARELREAVVQFLEYVLPANLDWGVRLLYNDHQALRRFTHAEMAAFTHVQLREEAY